MKNKLLSIWIFFHSFILIGFLISIFVSPKIHFGTSLFEILPPSSNLYEVQKADSALGNKTSRAITILVKSKKFENSRFVAKKFYENYVQGEILNQDYFDSLSLFVDSSAVSEITQWLFENRFFLLNDEDCSLLENGDAAEIASDALSTVYGAFSISDLSYLEDDPFLLTERNLKRFLEDGALSSTDMSLKDDVLACQKDDEWFVLIRGTVSEKGAALASKKNAVKNIYETAEKIQKDYDDEIKFVFSGVPFHSYESSSSAQNQISVISTVSLVLIFAVFLWIFRSFVPAIVSAVAVAFSCGIGFVSVLFFFREIHVLTFVFGTTLIGTCLDYSIHYFVNWKANNLCENGTIVRKSIFRGISLGFLSTEICFAALFFTPFPLLKQVSVFLFTGLATTYLSVVSLYPILKMPKNRGEISLFPFWMSRFACFKKNCFLKRIFKFFPLLLAFFSLIVICINYRSLKIENNIQELYSMSPKMLQNEILSAKVLNTGSSGWYFILKANSTEELLQKNEKLAEFLSKNVEEKRLENYLSVSQFIPSEEKQMRSFKASENFLPFVKNQYENLGFISDSAENSSDFVSFYKNNYRSLENNFIHPSDSNLPKSIREAIDNLWIGEIDGEFYSCVLPLHVSKDEENFFRDYAKSNEGIYFVNKVKDISKQLDILSKTMLKMLLIAFFIVIVILFFCYKVRLVFRIASVPILVTLVTTAILILAKIHLSFFPITALVLVFGLGLDYIIYAIEESQKESRSETDEADKANLSNLTNFAIFLSFITTALSFGALAISSFPPVHFLGLTVFVGLLTAVIGAMCFKK